MCDLTLAWEDRPTEIGFSQMGGAMKLRRLNKYEESVPDRKSPAMYVAEDPDFMVGQGWNLDDETTAELRDVDTNESGVLMPTETVLRGVAMLLAEHGHPAMRAEVEAFLAERKAAKR